MHLLEKFSGAPLKSMQSFFPDPMCPNQNVRNFPDVICAKLRTLPELITFRKLHTFSGRYRCRLFNHDHNFMSCLLRSNGHQLNIIHSFVRLKIALISWRYNDSTSILVISFQRNINSEKSLLLNVPNA